MAKKKIIEKREEKPKARAIQKTTFQVWFKTKVAQKTIRAHQASEIMVFFKKQGLKDREEMHIFDSKLKRFLGI